MQTYRLVRYPAGALAAGGLSVGILSAGFLLGGCASSPESSSTAASTSASAASSGASANAAQPVSATDSAAPGEPITIGYSDWPGWTVWDIADKQGFFKKEGVNVKLKWFEQYTDSINALSAGQVDANCQTWSDTMPALSKGQGLKAVLVNDNSYGNDAMIAQPGINSVKDLKGKAVATEMGTCDHLLMLKALEASGMKESDIKYTPITVPNCPAAMLSKSVSAAVVWEPSRTKILKDLKGSKVIFDSSNIPGLIPDLLVMKSEIVEKRPGDVQKIVNAWYDSLEWWRTHPDDAVKIMAEPTKTSVADYKSFIKGTRIFSGPEALAALTKSPKVTSLFTSGKSNADFLLKAKQIDKLPDYAGAIDSQFVKAAVAKGLGKLPPYNYTVKVAGATKLPAPAAGRIASTRKTTIAQG